MDKKCIEMVKEIINGRIDFYRNRCFDAAMATAYSSCLSMIEYAEKGDVEAIAMFDDYKNS